MADNDFNNSLQTIKDLLTDDGAAEKIKLIMNMFLSNQSSEGGAAVQQNSATQAVQPQATVPARQYEAEGINIQPPAQGNGQVSEQASGQLSRPANVLSSGQTQQNMYSHQTQQPQPSQQPQPRQPATASTNDSESMNDKIDMIAKIKKIHDKIKTNNNPHTNLLASLKPYLSKKRLDRLDQAIALVNITQIGNIIKDIEMN